MALNSGGVHGHHEESLTQRIERDPHLRFSLRNDYSRKMEDQRRKKLHSEFE